MILQSFLRGEIILSRFVKGDFLMKAVPKDDQEKWRKMLDAAGAGEKARNISQLNET